MNYQYFSKINCFAYIQHLTLLVILTIAFLPHLAIGDPPPSAESINAITPSKGSRDDSMMNSLDKQIASMAAGVIRTDIATRPYREFSYPSAQAKVIIAGYQIASYRKSARGSKKIKKHLTDDLGYTGHRSQGEFDQRDWGERQEHAAAQLRSLQSSFANQALIDHIEGIHRDVQKEIKNIESKGYKFDPKTNRLTLPGGKTIAAKDILTPEGFKTLGLSSKEFDEFKKQQKQNEKKARRQAEATVNKIIRSAKLKAKRVAAKRAKSAKSSNDYDSITQNGKKISKRTIASQKQGGAHGSRNSSFSSDWKPPSFQDILNKQKIKNGKNENLTSKSTLTMLSKQYGNDLIGHANNNIFDMIHRQYLRRRSQMMNTSSDTLMAER